MMRYANGFLGLAFWTLLIGHAQAATLYRWVGPQGIVTYQASPPPPSAAGVRVIPIRSRPRSGAPRDASQRQPVTVYEAPNCRPCAEVRAYLRRRRVAYRTINVAKSEAALRAMKARTGSMSVPTIVVGRDVLMGYVRSVLAGELKAAGYSPNLKGRSLR